MKTNYLKSVLTAIALFVTVAFATAIEPVISIIGEKKVVLVLTDLTEDAKLVLKDSEGYSFYSFTIEKSTEKFARSFDLTTLPNGNYSIEVEESTKITNFPLSIVNDKVSFSMLDKKTVFKPTILERGSKVIVTKFNPENKPLNVIIYNNAGELVYEETLNGKLDLGRIYNFSKVQGTYTIALQSDDKIYTKTVSIK